MHFMLLELIPYLLAIKRPKRKNNWQTIKESWRNRGLYDPEEGYASLHVGSLSFSDLDVIL